jgi:Diacylglycerol kinase catalytic domain
MQTIPPRRILIVFNPAAGHRRRARLDRVIAAVRALGCSVEVAETSWPGQAEAIARDAAATVDVIAAAGGDGTINEIVNGLDAKVIDIGIVLSWSQEIGQGVKVYSLGNGGIGYDDTATVYGRVQGACGA